jgi:hypothetical protein
MPVTDESSVPEEKTATTSPMTHEPIKVRSTTQIIQKPRIDPARWAELRAERVRVSRVRPGRRSFKSQHQTKKGNSVDNTGPLGATSENDTLAGALQAEEMGEI